jgi:hypothetical protein
VRVELPAGHWAELLDPKDLRAGDLKRYRQMMPVPGAREYLMEDLDNARDTLLVRVVTAWSLDLPIPKDLPGTDEEPGSLDRIEIPVYQALLGELGPFLDLFNGVEPDPKPSSESDGGSKDSESSSATS